jgi:hypothetical protein
VFAGNECADPEIWVETGRTVDPPPDIAYSGSESIEEFRPRRWGFDATCSKMTA